MTKVFIGGSRHVSRLNAEIRDRLDNIVEKGLPVLIGDAAGADKAVQEYLHSKHYLGVTVYCAGRVCRNNVGGWDVRRVPVASRERSAEFYGEKDRVMSKMATVGLMIWDGKSAGTLLNVLRLLGLGKKVVLYVVPDQRFVELRSVADGRNLLAGCDPALRRKVEERASLEVAKNQLPLEAPLVG